MGNGANLTFQLYGPIIGTLILAFLAYMLWQQLPGLLSSFASAMGNLGAAAGGYGKQLKRLSGSNKWNNGGASYDEYGDYYTSGTEHYEAQQEVNDIMRSSASEVKPGNAFYNGAFAARGAPGAETGAGQSLLRLEAGAGESPWSRL